jgi:N,N'-diacetyllegionaminate synthase
MRIGNIDLTTKVLIVAEIGNNHEGRFDVAQNLVRAAAACGVDAVKFQTFRTDYFTSRADEARFRRLQSFELTHEQFKRLEELSRSLGLGFISTALDLESQRFLEPLVDAYKIASGDNNFFPLIAAVCATGKPVIVSSGFATLAAIRRAKDFVLNCWRTQGITQELAVLHCVSSYPVPPEQADLAAIPLLRQDLGGTIGYSDHTIGVEASLMAVALGARIVEKHFTLDKHFSDFRDHQLSADPPEMRAIVDSVRKVEVLLGRPQKILHECERAIESVARRSVVASRALPAGHVLAIDDITWIRPASGLPPGDETQLVGRRLVRPMTFGQLLLLADVE